MKKTLLLNSSFEVLSFVAERKAFKLLIKNKVEIIDSWDDEVNWIDGKINHPAIMRLKRHVKRSYFNSNFSRKALIKRDRSLLQYCCVKLTPSTITIDHVLPRALGGLTSFTNCVVACHTCNNKKADNTLEQAHMVLIKKPTHPSFSAQHYIADDQEFWHASWDDYLGHN